MGRSHIATYSFFTYCLSLLKSRPKCFELTRNIHINAFIERTLSLAEASSTTVLCCVEHALAIIHTAKRNAINCLMIIASYFIHFVVSERRKAVHCIGIPPMDGTHAVRRLSHGK